jgi:hypothetical protein
VDISKELNISNQKLELVLEKHPYFQLGLIAKSKRLRKENHIDSLKTIRKCAISFPDRSLLHRYLHENDESINEKAKSEEEISSAHPAEESTILTNESPIDTHPTQDQAPEVVILDSKDEDEKHSEIKEHKKSEEEEALNKEYLIEAVNQSIQLEAQHYNINDLPIQAESNSDDSENKGILSFTEWIEGEKRSSTLTSKNELIDKFIQENPQISRLSEQTFYSPIEKGKESISEETILYTETLASIFAQQGNKSKAIKAYRYLMLKNPQKSVYFADLIKKLEE